jgi:hypothetical protein
MYFDNCKGNRGFHGFFVLIKPAWAPWGVPLGVEVFGDYVIACRDGKCVWLRANQSIDYYIERLGLINATCDDVGELASVLGMPQLVSAYCTPTPIPTLVRGQSQFEKQGLVIRLPNLSRGNQELVGLVLRHCKASMVGGSLVVSGKLTRECLTALSALLTVLNGAPSLVLDGRIVTIRRGEVCVGGDCLGIVDCDYDVLRWLRRLGLGLPSAVLTCGLVVLINNPTAGVSDQDAPKDQPNQDTSH